MTVEFVTIVLDGMPWITRHWPEMEKLPFDFRWHCVEGVSANTKCTSWCESMTPRLSNDGTTQYLDSIAEYDHRVILYRKEQWQGKVAMMNEPLRYIHAPCLLMEIDSDELWTADQWTALRAMFMARTERNCAQFYCQYKVGPRIAITSRETYGNNTSYEWKRAWRFSPGMRFETHEPPKIGGFTERPFTHAETEKAGLVFRHEAYSTARQVRWKESYYGGKNNPNGTLYAGSVAKWKRLQNNRKWPVAELSEFLPWVGKGVTADLINK